MTYPVRPAMVNHGHRWVRPWSSSTAGLCPCAPQVANICRECNMSKRNTKLAKGYTTVSRSSLFRHSPPSQVELLQYCSLLQHCSCGKKPIYISHILQLLAVTEWIDREARCGLSFFCCWWVSSHILPGRRMHAGRRFSSRTSAATKVRFRTGVTPEDRSCFPRRTPERAPTGRL